MSGEGGSIRGREFRGHTSYTPTHCPVPQPREGEERERESEMERARDKGGPEVKEAD
jgi:hypothetical protein